MPCMFLIPWMVYFDVSIYVRVCLHIRCVIIRFNVRRTAYSVRRTLSYVIQRTLYDVRRTAYSVHCMSYNVGHKSHIVQLTLYYGYGITRMCMYITDGVSNITDVYGTIRLCVG